jgi:hypothetical protein
MTTSLVVTTISAPTRAMVQFKAGSCFRGMNFIVVGDSGTPADFNLRGSDYYSVSRQLQSDFRYAAAAPLRHYARKNIGYLIAIANGSEIIKESDDDNFPLPDFWTAPARTQQAHVLRNAGWINVYKHFSSSPVWPRGLPLDAINQPAVASSLAVADCPIQQGLCNGDPDVDAIYRLVNGRPIEFEERTGLALAANSWCPFNSQNTTWWREAFPLLYLPATCSMRMTDIWRSLVAQRIAWTNGWSVLFHSPTVFQDRNSHDLMSDFEEEIQGYIHNRKIADCLERLSLKPGVENIATNLQICYHQLVHMDVLHHDELRMLAAWLFDLAQLQVIYGQD